MDMCGHGGAAPDQGDGDGGRQGEKGGASWGEEREGELGRAAENCRVAGKGRERRRRRGGREERKGQA